MPITPEQRAADDALEEAIRQAMVAYDLLDDNRMVTEWVVLVASQGVTPDVAESTSYQYLVPGDFITWHRLLGLVDTHRLLMAQQVMGS